MRPPQSDLFRSSKVEENLKPVEVQYLFTTEVMSHVEKVLAGGKPRTW